MKVYIYVTKGPKVLAHFGGKYAVRKKGESGLNGKVVASFNLNEIDNYEMEYQNDGTDDCMKRIARISTDQEGDEQTERVASNEDEPRDDCDLLKRSCLTFEGLGKFLFRKGECGWRRFYAWKIDNLEIYATARNLCDFMNFSADFFYEAPRSWSYTMGDMNGEGGVILPVRPEWVCRILNGEKTIEIRTTKPRSL